MKIFSFFCAIVGTAFLPFIFLCLVPFVIYRWCISKIYPIFSGSTLKILPLSSSIYTTRNKENHIRHNILVEIQFHQKLNYDSILECVLERMVEAKDRNGRAMYPELTHYVSPFMGYYFWTKESKFVIENHVQLITQVPNSNFKEKFLDEYFDPGKSPWKMVVIGTESDRRILFKYHHTLGDGYSMLNVLLGLADQTQEVQRKTSYVPWWKLLIFPTIAIYDLLTLAGETMISPWDKKLLERSKSRIYAKPRSVKMDVIKEISTGLGVSFTSTLFGAFGAGIRTFLAEEKCRIKPKVMKAFVPFPGSSHSRKLDNSYGIASLEIPTGLAVVDGMKAIDTNINTMKESTYPIAFMLLIKLVGLLPIDGCKDQAQVPPLFISAFPGPRQKVNLNGNPISGINFQMHLGGDFPLIINTLTYENTLTYVIGGDSSVFTELNVEDLSIFISQELVKPRNYSKTYIK